MSKQNDFEKMIKKEVEKAFKAGAFNTLIKDPEVYALLSDPNLFKSKKKEKR